MKIFNLKLLSMLILFFVVNPTLYSDTIEDSLNENIPKVYINCEWCDMDFIKTEIQFVNYVIDRTVADIHVLITTQTTGSGGTEYTITFIGQHNYKGLEDTLKFVSERLATDDTIRRGIVKLLKLGLMRYIAKTPIADKISISYAKEEKSVPTADRWKNWVFSIGVKGYFNGEQLTKYNSINGSFSANRTTENWKIRFYPNYNYTESSFKINDTTTVYSNSKSYGKAKVGFYKHNP
ncbi:MAG: hypothetical protein HY769_05060 [Candidatus Stahlbacteria bacterium]|nr:hypothetical protein [Candidatus Stahlbacteria bacterium]